MRVDEFGRIVLSRRNLLTLLHKLDVEGSKCTIIKELTLSESAWLVSPILAVKSEPDMVHYNMTGMPPGQMSDDTEEFLKSHNSSK